MNSKVPLQGAELEEYLQKEKERREKEAAQQAALDRNRLILEADEDESDSDSSDDEGGDDESELGFGEGGKGPDDWNMDVDEGGTRQYLSFDIYLKGNVSKAHSFFKTTERQTQRFRMFPYVEKKRKVDDYGETIDVGRWLRRGKVFEEEAESEETREARRKQAEQEAKVFLVLNYDRVLMCLEGSFGRSAIEVCLIGDRDSIGLQAPIHRHGGPERRPCHKDDYSSSQSSQNG
jgi:cleavage and polyadenylation specificity factor subunit 2